MVLNWQCICVDSGDPARDATFWQEALGWRRTCDEVDEVILEPPAGSTQGAVSPDILFLRVPEDKQVKNRLHFDLRPDDQAAEVTRLEGLGARRIDVGQGEQTFVVMADPAGNEFCVHVRSIPKNWTRSHLRGSDSEAWCNAALLRLVYAVRAGS